MVWSFSDQVADRHHVVPAGFFCIDWPSLSPPTLLLTLQAERAPCEKARRSFGFFVALAAAFILFKSVRTA